MKRKYFIVALAAVLGALASPSEADPIVWVNQGVKFTLNVVDSGGQVDAKLTVDRTADANPDLLAGVSIKIFNNDPPSASGLLVGSPSATWVGSAGSVGGQDGLFNDTTTPGFQTVPPGDGFYSAVYNAIGGEATGGTSVFDFRWLTDIDPNLAPSIKALTVLGTNDVVLNLGRGVKVDIGDVDKHSRQWSSGPLGSTPVPEPGTIALVAIGAAGYLVARRRRRSN